MWRCRRGAKSDPEGVRTGTGTGFLAAKWPPSASDRPHPAPGPGAFALEPLYTQVFVSAIRSLKCALVLNWRSRGPGDAAAHGTILSQYTVKSILLIHHHYLAFSCVGVVLTFTGVVQLWRGGGQPDAVR
eukprot:gene8614-biopygen3142